MRKYPTVKEKREMFNKLIKFIEQSGFIVKENSTHYQYAINTVFGILGISFYDFERPRSFPWVACRFENVELAKKYLYSGIDSQLNPYSGKYNFLPLDEDYFQLNIKRLFDTEENRKRYGMSEKIS